MYQMIRLQLLVGAGANITVGALFLFVPEVMLHSIGFDAASNQLFRLFVSGVAIGLGIGYAWTYRFDPDNLSLLFFGTCLKYWAFAVTLYCFVVHDLSFFMFLLFGIGNLLLAFNFSLFMYFRRR
jgi:hypothetical protein